MHCHFAHRCTALVAGLLLAGFAFAIVPDTGLAERSTTPAARDFLGDAPAVTLERTSGQAVKQGMPLPRRLQALVRDGISAQEVIGKALWERDFPALYPVIRVQDLDLDEYVMLLEAARFPDPQATAEILATGTREEALAALRESGVPYHRLLNAARLLVAQADISVEETLFLGIAPPPLGLGYAVNDLADTLEADWPFNALPEPPGPADPSLVNGRVEIVDGTPVLTVWGTPLERGFAHGVLMGERIAPAFDPIMREFFGHRRAQALAAVDLMFDFPDWALDEMKGILLGIRAVVSEEDLERFGNPTLADVKALNCAADMRMLGCSSVSVWGDRIGDDAGLLTGRNLDYTSCEALLGARQITVMLGREGHRPLVSVGWSGLVGCYSAMSADGVCLFIHDSATARGVAPVDSVPRSIALRHALETCDPGSMPESFRDALAEQFTVSGNNIHVSWPTTFRCVEYDNGTRAQMPHGAGAACIEWNGDEADADGATLRVPGDAGEDEHYLVVTNHYVCRGREEPLVSGRGGDSGRRYDTLLEAVRDADPGSVTPEVVRGWLKAVGGSGTLHSVIARPEARTLTVYFRREGTREGAPHQEGTTFNVDTLIGALAPERDGE